MKVLLRNAFVCDLQSPFNGKSCDILLDGNTIEQIELSHKKLFEKLPKGIRIVEAKGFFVAPAFVDLRADFCDPGNEQKESLSTGAAAALQGGFTQVALLPSTTPARDSKSGIEYVSAQAKNLPIHIYAYGCLTQHREGAEMAELYDMHLSGALAFTDGNRCVKHAGIMQRSLLYAQIFGGLVMQLADEAEISEGGKMHEGNVSTLLGLKGIPALAEELIIHRDIEILKYTGGKIHFSAITSKGSVELIKKAKKLGLNVTCDVAVANLCFSDENLKEYDSNYKVLPPLRSKSDQKALWTGLMEGVIDGICSNHHPQNLENKEVEFEYADAGMITLETLLPMLLMHKPDNFALENLLEHINRKPAAILNLLNSNIGLGNTLDLVLFDPTQKWTYNSGKSKSKNSPLLNQILTGKVKAVVSKETIHIL